MFEVAGKFEFLDVWFGWKCICVYIFITVFACWVYSLVGRLIPAHHRFTTETEYTFRSLLHRLLCQHMIQLNWLFMGRCVRSTRRQPDTHYGVTEAAYNKVSVSLTLFSVHHAGVLSAHFDYRGTFFIRPPRPCKRSGCPFNQAVPAFEVVDFRVIKVAAKTCKRFYYYYYHFSKRVESNNLAHQQVSLTS